MRRDYLSRLSRAARWYLPPAEAAEVLEDYQEIVGEASRSEEELCREIGTPKDAVGQLVQLKAYQRWLTVFAVLVACIVPPAITPFWQELSFNVFKWFRCYWFWDIGERVIPFTWVFFTVGMVVSLVWFRRNGREGRAIPKSIPPLLVLLLAGMALVWFMIWLILGEHWELMDRLFPTYHRASAMRLMMGLDIFAMGLIGLVGLVKARLRDRRWLAVYVLALSGVILGLSLWALITSIWSPNPGWANVYFLRYAVITLVGLIGMAVSLC